MAGYEGVRGQGDPTRSSPSRNWTRYPHVLVDSVTEARVLIPQVVHVLNILRATWGVEMQPINDLVEFVVVSIERTADQDHLRLSISHSHTLERLRVTLTVIRAW
ncbi:hypothetical protein GCM10007269_19340 [Microbacterium murale]|uniref:Uncharacterized protein n=1 Tax=Microbacterium murale TaxID=1081040 RepID=A0ABQ1RRB6_9MICO|nr:hypothetical protein GCM10007269_19340 [Microbacterium murale]